MEDLTIRNLEDTIWKEYLNKVLQMAAQEKQDLFFEEGRILEKAASLIVQKREQISQVNRVVSVNVNPEAFFESLIELANNMGFKANETEHEKQQSFKEYAETFFGRMKPE